MSGIRITRSRIVAVILAAAVLLLLFFNWLAIGGETKKEWDTVSSEVGSYIDRIESYGQWIGLDINLKALTRSARQLLNGKLTPAEMFGISGAARNAFKTLYKAIGRYLMPEKDYRTVMAVTGWYRAVFILAVIAVLFSIFIRATGILEKLDFLMIIFIGILFIVTCVISSVLSSKGIRMNITLFSVLALVFALPVQLIRKIPFLKPDERTEGSAAVFSFRKKKENLQCAVCGSDVRGGDRFCPNCGCELTEKLSTVVCKSCGSRMPSTAKFCENCGAGLEQK